MWVFNQVENSCRIGEPLITLFNFISVYRVSSDGSLVQKNVRDEWLQAVKDDGLDWCQKLTLIRDVTIKRYLI